MFDYSQSLGTTKQLIVTRLTGSSPKLLKSQKEQLVETKKRKSDITISLQALKKRKTACHRSSTAELRIKAREENGQLQDLINARLNDHVPGECDQLSGRGIKCKSRRVVRVIRGEAYCNRCFDFLIERKLEE